MTADRDTAPGGFRHVALLYHDVTGYLATVRRMIGDAQARAEPVHHRAHWAPGALLQ